MHCRPVGRNFQRGFVHSHRESHTQIRGVLLRQGPWSIWCKFLQSNNFRYFIQTFEKSRFPKLFFKFTPIKTVIITVFNKHNVDFNTCILRLLQFSRGGVFVRTPQIPPGYGCALLVLEIIKVAIYDPLFTLSQSCGLILVLYLLLFSNRNIAKKKIMRERERV